MNLLQQITERKKEELVLSKARFPVGKMKDMPLYYKKRHSLEQALKNAEMPGIIAEFKRRSPSKGLISTEDMPDRVVTGYDKAGVAAISVLTDASFFGGSLQDLERAGRLTPLPLLRKDFVIDPYQLEEARAFGADVVLLIAECLEGSLLRELHAQARELGLEVLVEVHDSVQLCKLPSDIRLLGVNNRDLTTFRVEVERSEQMIGQLPQECCCISESGLSLPETVLRLWKIGFRGFLMGEAFMKMADPGLAAREFIQKLSHDC